MARTRGVFVVLFLFVGMVAACDSGERDTSEATASDSPRAGDVDLEAVAHALVTRNAPIQEDELVLITGSPRDLELLENLSVQVRALGAHPLIILQTERMLRRGWDDVPERFDTQRDEWGWRLAEVVDWHIALDTEAAPDLLAHVPAERMAARMQANAGLETAWSGRGVGLVEVGNNLYPTRFRAERFGLSQAELSRLFWEGITADPAGIRTAAEAVRQALSGAETLHITHPNGTDLSVGVQGREIRITDGTVPETAEARIAEGGNAWLPAGEVFLSVVPGSAVGRVVVDRFPLRGEEILGLDLQFENGLLTDFGATSGLEAFREFYESAPAGKERLTVFDIGVNPGITNQRILTWSVSGMVTVFLGNDGWAGGDVDVPFGAPFHLPGATVRAGDRTIVDQGELVP
jgi:aminopeptidase